MTIMKLNLISKSIVFLSVLVFVSCAKKEVSNTTGWSYNDKKTGGFQVNNDYKQLTPPGMVFVEGGTFTMGRTVEDIPGDWNNVPRRITVSSFYMDQYEVSNVNWREYLHWMRLVFHNSPELIRRATPDSTVWLTELAYNEPYKEYYFSHVAYNNYPVVGVSWEQAMDYCTWRTDRVNEMEMYLRGLITLPDFESVKDNEDSIEIRTSLVFNTDKYLMNPEYQPEEGKRALKTAYGENRKTDMSDGILFPKFRLPTEAEWEYAAYGIRAKGKEENYGQKRSFPWDGNTLRNSEKKTRGEMQANFVRGRGDMMGMSGKLNDKATITAPVNAYFPNDFGLYNMAGNVSEWVLDVYRPLSSEVVEEYNSFRGNEYKSPQFNENTQDGKKVRVPVLDELGRVKYFIPVEKTDSTMAEYIKYDVRNYLDGDARSSKTADNWKQPIDPDLATKLLYDPDPTSADALLALKLTNTTRLYKGGSWKDRAYWINPSTRRFMEQKSTRSDVGFRCAMSKVGPEATQDR